MHMSNAEIWRFRQGGRMVSPQVGGRLALNNGEAMRDLAIAGLVLAMLPAFIVSAAVKNGILIEVIPAVETRALPIKIGEVSCRERGCKYVEIAVVAVY